MWVERHDQDEAQEQTHATRLHVVRTSAFSGFYGLKLRTNVYLESEPPGFIASSHHILISESERGKV